MNLVIEFAIELEAIFNVQLKFTLLDRLGLHLANKSLALLFDKLSFN